MSNSDLFLSISRLASALEFSIATFGFGSLAQEQGRKTWLRLSRSFGEAARHQHCAGSCPSFLKPPSFAVDSDYFVFHSLTNIALWLFRNGWLIQKATDRQYRCGRLALAGKFKSGCERRSYTATEE